MKMRMNNGQRKEMSCSWLLVGKTHFCENSARDQYCASHAFKIRKGVIIPQPCKGCGRGTKSRVQLCVQCGQDIHRRVLNLLTGRWISPNRKLFQKLIREGYRYANRLSDYLEDIGTICVGEFELDPLADFYYPALIPPLSILASRADIREEFAISVESVVEGITWDREETKAWRDDILKKFLHHPDLVFSRYKPNALYDAFTRTDVLEPEHVLALTRLLG
ncbi:hypothetical protein GLOIN_2v1709137 [Rhizophagus clarus]|uniref:Uncharacterized protein n=1 Tax=Rhizophagus clarus TaxID=94130 RepID=A0A8H3LXB1_9GLOM|nr:hypothetical protein GLOIN_2v1709137 [Rhizophagus clarus]